MTIALRCPYCDTPHTDAVQGGSFVCKSCGKAIEPPPAGAIVPPPKLPCSDDDRWSDGPPEESANRWSAVSPLGDDDSSPSVSVSQTSILPREDAEPAPMVRPARSPLIWLLLILVLFAAALVGVVMLARSVKPWLDARREAAQRATVSYWFPRLETGPADERRAAAQAIVALGPRAVVQTLEHISKDPGKNRDNNKPFMFATAAIDALAAVGPEVVPGLREGLRSREANVRAAAALTTQEMGIAGRPALDGLIAALEDENRQVRQFAMKALESMGSYAAPAAKRLADLAAAPDALERRHALDALGRIGPKARDILPALQPIAEKDADPMVRTAAKLAIKQIDVKQLARDARREATGELKALIAAVMGDDAAKAIEAADKLSAMSLAAQPAAASLALMLHSSDAARRVVAATALGKLGLAASDFIPTLESAAADDDDANVRAAAAKALDLINDKPK